MLLKMTMFFKIIMCLKKNLRKKKIMFLLWHLQNAMLKAKTPILILIAFIQSGAINLKHFMLKAV